MDEFQHKYGPWALIAGGSEGLGAAFAEQLAARGLNLALVARGAEALRALAARLEEQYAVQVEPIRVDLAEPDAARAIAGQVAGLDVGLLIYNAAYPATGAFFDIPLEEHLRELATNARAPLELTYAIGQRMLARGRGGLILISSLSASFGSAMIANYAATKAYNQVLAEGLWEELRGAGIDVLASLPSSIATPNYKEDLQSKGGREQVPAMPPEDVARETLAALGKGPTVIPGRVNRLEAFFMRRVLPRTTAIRLMGSVMRRMYGKNGN